MTMEQSTPHRPSHFIPTNTHFGRRNLLRVCSIWSSIHILWRIEELVWSVLRVSPANGAANGLAKSLIVLVAVVVILPTIDQECVPFSLLWSFRLTCRIVCEV